MKLKLLHIETPWQIEMSMAQLELKMEEGYGASVFATALFPPPQKTDESQEVEGKGDFFYESDFKRIEIQFPDAYYAAMQVAEGKLGPIDSSRYDWSNIKQREIGKDPNREWQLLVRKWQETGICPLVSMYEIADDPLLKDLRADRFQCKSYLILGNDAFVKVFAQSWSWRVANKPTT